MARPIQRLTMTKEEPRRRWTSMMMKAQPRSKWEVRKWKSGFQKWKSMQDSTMMCQ